MLKDNCNNFLKRSELSIADDVGSVFISDSVVYRAINDDYIEIFEKIMSSGLIDELTSRKLIPKTKVSSVKIFGYKLVLEHQKISPVIYPYEWSPEMLRRAAMVVLEVNRCANKYGFEIKDAHPYNVVFEYGSPLYVDFGSFVLKSNNDWVAYEEFVNSYCKVLRLVECGHLGIFRHVFLSNGTGFSGYELSSITEFIYKVFPVHIGEKIYKIFELYRRGQSLDKKLFERKFRFYFVRKIAAFLLTSDVMPFRQKKSHQLKKKIIKYDLKNKTTWAQYHHDSGCFCENNSIKLSTRMQWIVGVINDLSPATILELAANEGVLSRFLSANLNAKRIVCTDYDEGAIDNLLINMKIDEKVFIACFDFMADVRERLAPCRTCRLKSELVLALAVTHHLILTQKYSIDSIFFTLRSYSTKYLIVEFMPLGLWDGKFSLSTPEWYTEEWFVANLEKYFKILIKKKLEPNRIVFVAEVVID